MLANKFKIDFFELSKLFKVSFVFREFLIYEKLSNIIYFRTLDYYSKYYMEIRKIAKII